MTDGIISVLVYHSDYFTYPVDVNRSSCDTITNTFRLNLLKMLGLYLYTLIISHKSSNMLRLLNKLTLQKDLQIFVTNNVFLDEKVEPQEQQTKNQT